jgi:hypothetical protein
VATTEQKTVKENVRDLWQLLIDYSRQEMVDPLKGLGRYIGWGVGSAVFCAFGFVLLSLGLLRALQTLDATREVFDGNWSFAPYLLVFIPAFVLLIWASFQISKDPKRRA